MAKRQQNDYNQTPKKPVSQKSWFEGIIVLSSLGLAWLLWNGVLYAPVDSFEPTEQLVNQAHSLEYAARHGQIMDMLPSLDLSPLYSLLLAIWLEVTQLVAPFFAGYGIPIGTTPHDFQMLLFVVSVILVHYVTRRQLSRPFNYIVSALYALAPMTILKGVDIGPVMANIVFTLTAWLFTDIAFNAKQPKPAKGEILPSMPRRMMVNKKALLAATFAIAAAALCHPAGYVLLIAFGLTLIRKKATDTLVKSLLVFLSVLLPFGISHVYHHTHGFSQWSLDAINPFIHMTIPSVSLIQIHAQNFLNTLTHLTTSSITLFGFDPANLPAFQWMITAFMLTGLFFGFRHKTGLGATYLLLYTLVFYILSEAEPTISPALPLLLIYLYHGLKKIGDLMGAMKIPFTPIVAPVLTGLILLGMFGTYWQDINQVSPRKVKNNHRQVAAKNSSQTVKPTNNHRRVSRVASNQIYTPAPVNTYLARPEMVNQNAIKTQAVPPVNVQPMTMVAIAEPNQQTPVATPAPKNTERTVRWINSNLASSAKIAVPQNYDLETNASPAATIGSKLPESQIHNIYVNEETPDMLIERLMKSEYVLEDWDNPTSNANLTKTLSLYHRHFRLIYNDAGAKVRIWEIL